MSRDSDQNFKEGCSKAGIPETSAQFSKWRRGYGVAYTSFHGLSLGSRINEKSGLEFSDQKASGSPSKLNDYGPYSATPNATPQVRK